MAELPAYEDIKFSLFHIEVGDASQIQDSWNNIQKATRNMLTDWGIKHLRKGLDSHVKTVLVEMPYVCEDFRSLHRHFYGRKFRERPSKCARLHFFNEKLSEGNVLLEGENTHYIGFSVVEPLMVRCIGRTVVNPEKVGLVPEEYHLLSTRFHNRIGGTLYECHGFPYRTQSNEATVCAHVTMWAVCRYLSQKFKLYRRHLPYELIEMAGRRNGRVIPHHGLSYADYSEMLDQFGCYPVIVSNHGMGPTPFSSTKSEIVNQRKYREFLKSLYCYIESGFPLIATFGEHVVSIVGHVSLDHAEARARAEKRDGPMHASELVDEYVVMDDNCFPYQIMPRKLLGSSTYGRALEKLRGIVVPLPDEVYLRPRDVDFYTNKLLNDLDFKKIVDDSLLELELDEPVVYRPFLTTGASFKQFKRKELFDTPNDLAIRLQLYLSLPRFIWCVELSTPGLRAENRAFGEILLDATAGESDLEPVFVRIGSKLARSNAKQAESQLDYFGNSSYSTFAQYRHNLGAPTCHASKK